ncbi:MAG: hypothetical protein HC838_06515 [Spirulinaceae cyanobacterium RM2_2_10]|nr:hypothetical protein [Spirulinaceae cyanobacterium RM2_2_10]
MATDHDQNLDFVYRDLHIFNLASAIEHEVWLSRYTPLSEVLGLVGWLTLLAALLVLCYRRPDRKLDLSAMVAIWPLFVLLNPLLVSVLMRLLAVELLHRLFYGMPVLDISSCLFASHSARQPPTPTAMGFAP